MNSKITKRVTGRMPATNRILTVVAMLLMLVTGTAYAGSDRSFDQFHSVFFLTKYSSLKYKAENGDPSSQFRLANIYFEPERDDGIAQNFRKAAQWYHKAAMRGHPSAQYNLALMFDEGLGVDKDLVSSYVWYKVASLTDNPAAKGIQKDAISAMTDIREQLTDQQRAEADSYLADLQDRMERKRYRAPLER